MIVKTYGLYDGVAKEFIRTFTSTNDETAERACYYLVREPNFDEKQGQDFIVQYLYAMDTATGQIVDNDVHVVCSLATHIHQFKQEKLEKGVFDNNFNEMINSLVERLSSLEKKVFAPIEPVEDKEHA